MEIRRMRWRMAMLWACLAVLGPVTPRMSFYSFRNMKPTFVNKGTRTIDVPEGSSVALPCSVNNLGDNVVSWYTGARIFKGETKDKPSDRRFMLLRESATQWDLCIRNVRKKDEGNFECSINTTPSIFRKIRLNVKDSQCADDEIPCRNGQMCYMASQQCDGHWNCTSGSDEKYCDRCEGVQCANGGINIASPDNTSCCMCPKGLIGPNCEECDSKVLRCKNGTLSKVPKDGVCECECNEGYTGKFCQNSGDFLDLPKQENCLEHKLDVVFALDTEDNLEDSMFEFVRYFMELKSSPRVMDIGLLTLNNHTIRHLAPVKSYEMLISSMKHRRSQSLKSRTKSSLGKILEYVDYMFHAEDKRAKVTDLLVLTVSGQWDLSSAADEAHKLFNDEIHVMVVTPENTPEAITIASHHDAVIPVGDFTQFSPFEAAQSTVLALCTACDKDWLHIGDSCYRLFTEEDLMTHEGNDIRWTTAEAECREFNSQLVSINTEEEYRYLMEGLISGFHGKVHIGMRRDPGTVNPMYKGMLRWADGKPPVYVKWGTIDSCQNSSDGPTEEVMYYSVVKCVALEVKDNCSVFVGVECAHAVGKGFICETGARSRNHTSPSEMALMIPPEAKASVEELEYGLFKCLSGELIALSAVCDYRKDCSTGDDELNCTDCASTDIFRCSDGTCISVGQYCDFINDCPDGTDENCVHLPCSGGQWQCENKECIPGHLRCDLSIQCIDRSDEMNCEQEIKNSFRCFDGSNIPRPWRCDGIVDCPGPNSEDESSCQNFTDNSWWGCGNDFENTFNILDACDGTEDCPNGYDETDEACLKRQKHICTWNSGLYNLKRVSLEVRYFYTMIFNYSECANVNCSKMNAFKCPGAYCIVSFMVCNGVYDCPNGEDEAHCDTVACPGFFSCANDTSCIKMSWYLDNYNDCPLHDDESFYFAVCSATNCSCRDASITCSNPNLLEGTVFHQQTRKINISSIDMNGKDVVKGLYYLAELVLTNCSLKVVPSLTDLWNLLLLDLSLNEISALNEDVFEDLGRLRVLILNKNKGLQYIQPGCCGDLVSLESLELDYTGITEINPTFSYGLSKLKSLSVANAKLSVIRDRSFDGLDYLEHVILTGNPHIEFDSGVYEGVSSLKKLETDNYYLCCEEVRPESLEEENCKAPNYGLSSCTDLLQAESLKFFIWILSASALLGNAMSLCYRLAYDKASLARGYGVFVSNLGVSDFIMGIYMLIIAIADTSYRGEYMWEDYGWRHSWVCQLAGFLSTISCETSTFFICLITLDRFLVIRYPFGTFKFKRTSAIVTSLLVWLVCLILAGVPLLPSFIHWNLYTKSSVCLALPLMDMNTYGHEYSVAVFIGINFVAFLLIAVGQAAIYKSIKTGAIASNKKRFSQDMAVAKKLSLIVITDFICWFPICVMGMMAASGMKIPSETYAWTAVFVLPINSAINPFLYTFLSAVQRRVRELRRGSRATTSFREDTDSTIGTTLLPKVTIGFPETGLVSLRTYMDTDIVSKNDLVKCLGQIIASLPKLRLCQKRHKPLTPNNIFVSAKAKVLDQICFSVEEGSERDIGEDAASVLDIIKIWSDAQGQSLDKEPPDDQAL